MTAQSAARGPLTGRTDSRMFILGLTGPSGAGKSRVAAALSARGYAVVDADMAARSVVVPGSPCLEALCARFGKEILLPDGSLDRRKLAAAAFATESGVEALNAITHPFIMERIGRELAALAQAGCRKAVLDAPALFEAGGEKLCDRVAAVIAPRALRLARIMLRDGITPEEAQRRVDAQKQREFYTGRADYVIENTGSEAALAAAVEKLARALERSRG